MRKNDVAVFGIFNLIYLTVSCLLASLACAMVLWAVRFAVPGIDFAGEETVRAVVTGLASVALCAVLSYRDGYHYARFSLVGALLSAGAAGAVHFALGAVTRFWPVAFGPTKSLAGLIRYGGLLTEERMAQVSFGILALVGALIMLVYIAVFVLAGWLGCKNRLRDRAETKGESTISK